MRNEFDKSSRTACSNISFSPSLGPFPILCASARTSTEDLHYYLPFDAPRIVRIAEQTLDTEFGGRAGKQPLWTIRVQPAIPISSLLVTHQFYDECLSTFLLAVPVVLRMHKIAAVEFVLDGPNLAGRARIAEHVTPVVRYIRRCHVRVDVTHLQRLFYPSVGQKSLASLEMLKERLFRALTHMFSLVSLELEIFRTEAFVERFVVDIAPLAELRKLQRLESFRITFTDNRGNKKLVQDWQRNAMLLTNLRDVSISE